MRAAIVLGLAHLEKIFDSVVYSSESSSAYVVVELLCYDGPFTMVLATEELRQGDGRIQQRYGLAKLRSDGNRLSNCPVHSSDVSYGGRCGVVVEGR